MPKIKDLGINTIPMTMRPGLQYFAGGQQQTACSEATCGKPSDWTSACGDTSCAPDTSACGDTSCRGNDDQSGCSDTTCVTPRPRSPRSPRGPKKASAFHPDAIAQLRQQLESQIGM